MKVVAVEASFVEKTTVLPILSKTAVPPAPPCGPHDGSNRNRRIIRTFALWCELQRKYPLTPKSQILCDCCTLSSCEIFLLTFIMYGRVVKMGRRKAPSSGV